MDHLCGTLEREQPEYKLTLSNCINSKHIAYQTSKFGRER